jgi:acyl-CoA thioester hydrolase
MKTVSECGFLDKENGCRVTMTDLAKLPRYHRQKIPEDYLDAMGHMNVRWYMALFDAASWQFFAAHGIDEAYIRNRQLGGFALKHHIQYLAEVQPGQQVAVRTRLLGRSERRIHMIHFLVNETLNQLAATLESLGTHADMRLRRSAEMPPDVAALMDATLDKHSRLDWEAPICGVIRV